MLALAANVFVVLFALDAVLSLVEEALRQLGGSSLLVAPRNLVAGVALLASIPCFLLLALTPRLPWRLLLPLTVALVWLNSGAAPLPMWFESAGALAFTTASIQVGIALLALRRIRGFTDGRSLLFDRASLLGPGFAWGHSLRFGAACLLLLLPFGSGYVVVWGATQIHLATAGFVSFDLRGVTLLDRRYVREDREIRLVGMMHIGEGDAYRELFRSFATESTVVLEEGVSDRESLVGRPISYGGFARALGLEEQPGIGDVLRQSYWEEEEPWEEDLAWDEDRLLPEWPHLRHADVDVGEFSVITQEFLREAAGIWDTDEPAARLEELTELLGEDAERKLAWVEYDLITRRNEHLIDEVFRALPEYRNVVVAWGGLHLPAIEAEIADHGFQRAGSTRRRLLTWGGVLAGWFRAE